jgi:sugar phosphate isomerase/epimerase
MKEEGQMKRLMFILTLFCVVMVAAAQDFKLAVQAYTFRDRSFVETVQTAKRLGIKYIEMYPGQRIGGDMEGSTDFKKIDQKTTTQLKNFIDAAGVQVVSYGVTNAKDKDQWDQLARFAHAIGIKTIQTEIVPDRAKFDLAEKMAAKHNLTIAIHNHRQEFGKPEGILKQLEGRGSLVGAGCDIGHWMRVGVKPLDGIKLLKGKFVTLHLVDIERIGNERGIRDVPYGTGAGNLKAVLDELRSQGFKGYLTLEYEHQSEHLEKEVGECVAWFNKYMAGKL